MKPIEKLTDEELCREGAEAMGARESNVAGYVLLPTPWRAMSPTLVCLNGMLTNLDLGLPILARIKKLGYYWDAGSNPDEGAEMTLWAPPFEDKVWQGSDNNLSRLFMRGLVAAWRHSKKKSD